MWYLSTSIIFAAIISMEIIHGLHAITISIDSRKFEEDLGFYLEEPMDKCDNQEHENVQLVNMGLEIVRENFIDSVNVKSINLENNKIVDISSNAFKAVPNLSCLNIRRNYVSTIFDKFLKSFNHTLLIKLNLAQTTLKKTYESLDEFISNENIVASSEIYLPNVTHLDLSDNNLETFPTYIKTSFPRLTHLYLSGNNLVSLNFIPPTTRYKNLAILSVRNCTDVLYYMEYLNKGNLVDLDMSSNNIKDIGKYLTTLCPQKDKDENVSCSNCNGSHPANYEGCLRTGLKDSALET
ncbi:toll-like receptor 3 [Polistes fuscatus]|uniref:toll-like receptor 3 n=1 Tax=Polistes fuscatus TaxID=30207 RepID=UPI001CA999CF|nr:toll-like receptor 3 [Polistes fuscatus]